MTSYNCSVAMYKGQKVSICTVDKFEVNLSRNDLIELVNVCILRTISHYAICSHVKYASDITVLFLLETFCLPLLSYACEALSFSNQQLNQLNVCWNRAYRKAFHMRSWESVNCVDV